MPWLVVLVGQPQTILSTYFAAVVVAVAISPDSGRESQEGRSDDGDDEAKGKKIELHGTGIDFVALLPFFIYKFILSEFAIVCINTCSACQVCGSGYSRPRWLSVRRRSPPHTQICDHCRWSNKNWPSQQQKHEA